MARARCTLLFLEIDFGKSLTVDETRLSVQLLPCVECLTYSHSKHVMSTQMLCGSLYMHLDTVAD